MAYPGYRLTELESVLPGPVRVRITSLGPNGQWACACWACGCRAEGPCTDDLLLHVRCRDHRTVALRKVAV